MEKLVRKMRESRRRTAPARRGWIMPDEAVIAEAPAWMVEE